MSKRSVYSASHSRAKLNQAALYLEDQVSLGRLELRPGVRFSYDDLMENIDTAPRLASSYDLFGNGRSKVIAGWNRYYGDTLLTYKLREGIALSETQSRSTVIDNDVEWTTASLVLVSDQFSKLKTPFTDETVVGFDQLLWGGTTGFRYVRRDGEDEFARERDAAVSGEVRYSRLNNNGKSHYESYRLSWERHWSAQFLSMNIAYASSTSTHDDYDDILVMDDLNEQIWYDGELLDADELPRNDFNRRWVASLLYSVAMDYGFRFTNTTNFRSGYENIIKSSEPPITIDGIDYSIYYKEKRPSSTIFDWRIDWIPPAFPAQALTVTLEIFNLLNKRTYVGGATDEYELGRQFWAGVEYTF
ncbi:MAG: hypothetical protein IBX47_13365 [Desulfuromonadales bacterium]|nr:hypothetical protein [Desulfuromonadales bacterium]